VDCWLILAFHKNQTDKCVAKRLESSEIVTGLYQKMKNESLELLLSGFRLFLFNNNLHSMNVIWQTFTLRYLGVVERLPLQITRKYSAKELTALFIPHALPLAERSCHFLMTECITCFAVGGAPTGCSLMYQQHQATNVLITFLKSLGELLKRNMTPGQKSVS
jgi:hypothetical protein